MKIDIDDLRVQMRQMNDRIISGLKDRSRYKQNGSLYLNDFADTGESWLEDRLRFDQSVDSRHGKHLFPENQPVLFKVTDLAPSKIIREVKSTKGVLPVDLGLDKEIIKEYLSILHYLCEPGEDIEQYGETVKCDSNNILLYNERITGIGRCVAEWKIQNNPSLLYADTEEEMKEALVVPEVEKKGIAAAVNTSEKYDLNKPDLVRKFMRTLIDMTVKAEIVYVQAKQEQMNKEKNYS